MLSKSNWDGNFPSAGTSSIVITWSSSVVTNSHLSVSNLQLGLFSPEHNSSTPESRTGLLLSSRCLRLEDGELRTDARAEQLPTERLQPPRLRRTQTINIFCSPHLNYFSSLVFPYLAVLEALTTGRSFRKPVSEDKYFVRSNTSRFLCEDNKKKTRADPSAGDSVRLDRRPELMYCCICSTREWSFSSFRQWKRLMYISAGRSSLIFFWM